MNMRVETVRGRDGKVVHMTTSGVDSCKGRAESCGKWRRTTVYTSCFLILKGLLNCVTIICLFSCLVSVSCTDLYVPCFVVVDLYFFYNYTHKLGGYEAVSVVLHSGYNKLCLKES